MSDLMTKLKALARGPHARAMLDKARREAAKPENRRRLEQLRARATKRR